MYNQLRKMFLCSGDFDTSFIDCNQCVPEEGHQAETSEKNIVSNIWSWFLTKTK